MKEKMNNPSLKAIISIMLLIISISFISATNIGISPAKLQFKDVLRGGYSEKVLTITVDSNEEVDVKITPWGNVSDWLNFSEIEFKVSKNSPKNLLVSVNPPSDIPNGNYSAFIRVKISGLSTGKDLEGHATGIINPVLDSYVTIEITDIEYRECRARNYKVYSTEEGEDIIFRTNVLNQGNVRLNPRIKVNIWDQEQIELLYSKDFSTEQIMPTKEKEVEIKVPSTGLKLGQYWVEVSAIDCYSSETLTFDILEEGALKSIGSLTKIITAPWVNEKETTKIEAFFENTGEKDLTAYFKGKITKEDKTIQLIESEKTQVRMDNEEIFDFYFTPQNPGRYIVTGRVFYNNKRTYEKSAVINVRPKGINIATLAKYLLLIVLLIGIIYLSYKIKKEKKDYKRKWRHLK